MNDGHKNKIKDIDKISNLEELRQAVKFQRRAYNSIIHEIRSQVGIVSNLSEMLLDDNLKHSHDFYKISLKQTSDLIVQLSEEFLQVEKLNQYSSIVTNEMVIIGRFMDVFTAPFIRAAGEKGLLLKLHVDVNCPKYFNVDERKLRQILSNLIGNAIKYTEEGFVHIHVHPLQVGDNQAESIIFDIIDSGIGLEDDLPNGDGVFSAYRRLDAAKAQQGFGLGLWIVKNLVTAMSGTVEIVSNHPENRNGGTCFRVSLPQNLKLSNVKKTYFDNDKAEVDHNRSDFIDGQLLLVEDNKLNQHIIGTMLSSAGFEFDIAASIVEAEYLYKMRDYCLILMDLNLPDGRGEEFSQKHPNQIIVALSADVKQDSASELEKLGFNGFVAKPIVIRELFRTIYTLLPKKPKQ